MTVSDTAISTATSSTTSSSTTSSTAASSSTTSNRATATSSRSVAAQPSASDDGPADTEADIVESVVYRRLPDGRLEATVVYEVPPQLTALEFQFQRDDLEVVETEGFERSATPELSWNSEPDGSTFTWDGHTDAPRVVVRHDVPRDTPATYAGGTDDWAVVLRPSTSARWRYDGSEPEFGYDAAVEGEGVAGEQFLVLGPHEVHERTVAGERIRLVVPDAADAVSSPERILDVLADASERLDVGHRSDVVTVVATPTDGVEWAHRGLSLGPDARVAADVSVDRAADLWVHEYVHTRQDRAATTQSTEWLVEATAEYYAATAALERGQVGFEDYRSALSRGASGQGSESVLAEPESWQAQANYRKGALVVAAIDRELRAATDGEATFQDVVSAWNAADEFDADDLAATLESLGGPAVRSFAEEYTATDATPEFWDAQRHRRVFDVAFAQVTADEPTVSVRGTAPASPFADGALALSGGSPSGSNAVLADDSNAVLAGDSNAGLADDSTAAFTDDSDAGSEGDSDASLAAESEAASADAGRVVATVAVANEGDAPGRYRIPLRVDGAVATVATGELAPGESRTVSLEHEFRTPGEHAVQVGRPGETRHVTVDTSGGPSSNGFAALTGFDASIAGFAAVLADAPRRSLGVGDAGTVARGSTSAATASPVAQEERASTAADAADRSAAAGDQPAGVGAADRSNADGAGTPSVDAGSAPGSTADRWRTPGVGVLAALIALLCAGSVAARP